MVFHIFIHGFPYLLPPCHLAAAAMPPRCRLHAAPMLPPCCWLDSIYYRRVATPILCLVVCYPFHPLRCLWLFFSTAVVLVLLPFVHRLKLPASVVVFHRLLPSSLSIIVFHHRLPSSSSIIVFHHRLPSSSSIIVFHHRLPSSSSIIVFHHRLPSSSSIIVCHCSLFHQLSFINYRPWSSIARLCSLSSFSCVLSLFSCVLSLVSGLWSLVSGLWSLVSCLLSLVSCLLSLVSCLLSLVHSILPSIIHSTVHSTVHPQSSTRSETVSPPRVSAVRASHGGCSSKRRFDLAPTLIGDPKPFALVVQHVYLIDFVHLRHPL
ncbi:unnamed protein product [Penicillium salamii]|nr:unnamed protein product [Penicillium salamii]